MDVPRVATISYTTHSRHLNYGAVLHGWAFQQVLKRMGCESIAIDYLPRDLARYHFKWPVLGAFRVRFWRHPLLFSRRVAQWLVSSFANIRKLRKFERFFHTRMSVTSRMYSEEELKAAIAKAFNNLPKHRDKLIRMHERIHSAELARVNREIAEIDERTGKLGQVISGYAKNGRLSARNLALYGGDDADVEVALDRISAELNEMAEQREQLMLKKGELGMREVQVHSLLVLIDAILEKESEPVEAPEDGSCSDIETFYGLTDRIVQWGPLKEYDNELFKRFVEKVVVREKGIEVRFKAGLVVKA